MRSATQTCGSLSQVCNIHRSDVQVTKRRFGVIHPIGLRPKGDADSPTVRAIHGAARRWGIGKRRA